MIPTRPPWLATACLERRGGGKICIHPELLDLLDLGRELVGEGILEGLEIQLQSVTDTPKDRQGRTEHTLALPVE